MKTRCQSWNKIVWTLAAGTALGMAHGAQAQKMSGRMDGKMSGKMSGGMHGKMGGSMGAMHMKESQMLIATLSEEKTEINTLSAQQAALKKMGGAHNVKLAGLLGRMIADHKKGGPTLEALIRKHGGNPKSATIMKPPVLGSEAKILQADMADHMKAVETSKSRHSMSKDPAAKAFYMKRVGVASSHMEWMKPYTGSMKGHMMGGHMKH